MKPLMILCLISLLCVLPANAEEQSPKTEPVPSVQSAWVVYWDLEGARKEAEMVVAAGGTLSFFAAYYDASDALYVPPELLESAWALQEQYRELPLLLTVVNDRLLEEGGSVLKDADLVRRLLADEESMRTHAGQLVELAQLHGFAGIDMDYENLGNNKALWRQYALFLEILFGQLQQAGLQLRVTLEPRALDKATYPKGPDYAVMLYNLRGPHSGPGPKATYAFIRTTLRQARRRLGPGVQAAFSTGGFVWLPDGKVQDVTEQQAAARQREGDAQAVRDPASGALHFVHREGARQGQELWYADGQTLHSWKQVAAREGVTSFALWRLGGNVTASLAEYLEAPGQQRR